MRSFLFRGRTRLLPARRAGDERVAAGAGRRRRRRRRPGPGRPGRDGVERGRRHHHRKGPSARLNPVNLVFFLIAAIRQTIV